MRTMLMIMLGFTAFTAIASGILLMLKPDDGLGLSPELLTNTPFPNYFIPALVLTVIVGGSNLIAFLKTVQNKKSWFFWSVISGIVICGWIIVQIILIREFFWLQWLYLLIGFFILLITLQLRHKELI
jgi:hypothetical protein